jgi:beta-lactamase regulating signal transducer with metallopeptidase domain
MQTSFFANAYFLQSVGWAVANSFWQAAILWIVYQSAAYSNKKLPALIRYQLSLFLIFIAAIWFGFTALQNYLLLSSADTISSPQWLLQVESLNKMLPVVAVLYFGMLGFHIFQFARQYLELRFVSKNGLLKAPADIRMFTAGTALHLGIKKKVQVWLSNHVDVPSVTGFIKPIILLPAAVINHLSTDQVNAILLHELAHIKRNDFLLNLLQSSVALMLFFKPFVGLLNKIAKRERENCCDDWVINFRYNPREYAKALLVLEEQRHLQLMLVVSATNDKKILLHRIKRLFDDPKVQININRFQKFQLAGLTFIILILIGLLPSSAHKQAIPGEIAVIVKPAVLIKTENKDVVVSEKEHPSPIIYSTIPKKAVSPQKKVTAKKQSTEKKQIANTEDYNVLAMVNEDALPGTIRDNETKLTVVSNKEKDSLQHAPVFVKIEEEQSGKQQSLTYYFKLKKDDGGKTDVKPLLFIKKYTTTKAKKALKSASPKKRITT